MAGPGGRPALLSHYGSRVGPGGGMGEGRPTQRLFSRCHTLGIQARLMMLVLVTALPLVAVASFAILRTVDDRRAQSQRDVGDRVENLLGDVDRQIAAIQAELQVLALSPSLQNGDFPAFDQQMRAALNLPGSAIVLHDTNAQQLLNTN